MADHRPSPQRQGTGGGQPALQPHRGQLDRAWVEYSWGDFKHDPKQVLARYFDAYLYMANWGSRELMFRFPKALLDRPLVEPYCLDHCVEMEAVGEYWILSITLGVARQELGPARAAPGPRQCEEVVRCGAPSANAAHHEYTIGLAATTAPPPMRIRIEHPIWMTVHG